jgi:hypothetical protein
VLTIFGFQKAKINFTFLKTKNPDEKSSGL